MTAEDMYGEWRTHIVTTRPGQIPLLWYELPEAQKQAWERVARKCKVTLSSHRCLDREIPDQRARHAELEAKYARLQLEQDALPNILKFEGCTCQTKTPDPEYHSYSCEYRKAQVYERF